VATEVCLSVGTLPITARFEQNGNAIAGVVTYQGVASSVEGSLNGNVVRLDGGFGDDPQALRFEIRNWRTEFVGADEMSGTFTLNVTAARTGLPSAASVTILVSKLRRSSAS
jgi:hypothetical protein